MSAFRFTLPHLFQIHSFGLPGTPYAFIMCMSRFASGSDSEARQVCHVDCPGVSGGAKSAEWLCTIILLYNGSERD
jgi:hypothetical protein